MKGKLYVIILLGLCIIVGGSIFIALQRDVVFNAPQTILSTQAFSLTSSHALATNSVSDRTIFLQDESGKDVEVTIELINANQISIDSLSPGKYKLHISKKAFKNTSFTKQNKTVAFEVIDRLQPISSNEQLKRYFTTLIKKEKQTNHSNQFKLGEMREESSSAMDMDTSAGSYSETNNQVEGIEEADETVTDGETIYTIKDNSVYLVDIKNPTIINQQAKIDFPEDAYVNQLALHENNLIISYTDYSQSSEEPSYLSMVAIYDVTDKKAPKKVREYGQAGDVIALRKTATTLYLVTQNIPNYWILEQNSSYDLRPRIYDSAEDTKTYLSTDKISILPNSEEPVYTIISALNLQTGVTSELKIESYLGGGGRFYMSQSAMYITVPKYNIAMESGRMMDIAIVRNALETTIYRFTVNDTEIQLAGQAVIPGEILNQFSMDEYRGYFRVAATQGNTRGENADSSSALYIFNTDMQQTGIVKDLAKGERIYSARFIGDKAFVVTFKETDPLFTFDLSNPSKPTIVGELKIPGYSTYLHPIDENHLLGIGFETTVKKDEYTNQEIILQDGLKISLFDVTDLANPIEQDVEIVGERGSFSEVIYNHKAFFRNTESKLYGFPVSLYGAKDVFKGQGAYLFHASDEKGIENVTTLMSQISNYEEWEDGVRRILYSGDQLYVITYKGVKSYSLNDYSNTSSMTLQ